MGANRRIYHCGKHTWARQNRTIENINAYWDGADVKNDNEQESFNA
jgi:hypothetical protein